MPKTTIHQKTKYFRKPFKDMASSSLEQQLSPPVPTDHTTNLYKNLIVDSMADEVKVLGLKGSFYSPRVEIALKLKGVEYEYIEEDISNKSPLLLRYNPVRRKVPVLVYNGKPIVESLVILEYIDETLKNNPILPQDPYERSMARFWAKFIDEKCNPAIWRIVLCTEKEERRKAIEEACEHLMTLQDELKNRKFFGGETIGFVDIVANFIGYWVGVIEEAARIELITKEKFPLLRATGLMNMLVAILSRKVLAQNETCLPIGELASTINLSLMVL